MYVEKVELQWLRIDFFLRLFFPDGFFLWVAFSRVEFFGCIFIRLIFMGGFFLDGLFRMDFFRVFLSFLQPSVLSIKIILLVLCGVIQKQVHLTEFTYRFLKLLRWGSPTLRPVLTKISLYNLFSSRLFLTCMRHANPIIANVTTIAMTTAEMVIAVFGLVFSFSFVCPIQVNRILQNTY